MKEKAVVCAIVLMGMLLAGCAPAASSSMGQEIPVSGAKTAKSTQVAMATSSEMMGKTPDKMMETAPVGIMETTPEAMGTQSSMMAAGGWYGAALTNVADDKKFTLMDFKGKVILVETMAIWCPTCLAQQKEVVALHKQLAANDELISVSLDIDPNEQAGDLKAYIAQNGFKWHYAVAPQSVARAIGEQFGALFLNPPATPMFIIDRDGSVHPLPIGLKKVDVLKNAVQPFLDKGM